MYLLNNLPRTKPTQDSHSMLRDIIFKLAARYVFSYLAYATAKLKAFSEVKYGTKAILKPKVAENVDECDKINSAAFCL